jgi:hypothetical protein
LCILFEWKYFGFNYFDNYDDNNNDNAYALSLCLRRVSFAIQEGLAFQLTSSPAFTPTAIEDVFDIT